MKRGLVRPGRKLKIARVTADLRQCDLAERAGVHQTLISLLERGKRGTTIKTAGRIADALGCDIEDLMSDEAA